VLIIGRILEREQNLNQEILGHFSRNGNEFDKKKDSETDSDFSESSKPNKGLRNFSIGILSTKEKNGRNNYSEKVIEVLIQWLHHHIEYPYPNQQDRVDL
jgi:hemerythrin